MMNKLAQLNLSKSPDGDWVRQLLGGRQNCHRPIMLPPVALQHEMGKYRLVSQTAVGRATELIAAHTEAEAPCNAIW